MAQLDLSVDPVEAYERKRMDAHAAAALVESGDLIWMPSSHQPPAVLAALAAREDELRDVTIRSVVIPNMGWFREDAAKTWNLQVQYALAPDNREALADRLIDFHPLYLINQHKAGDFRGDEGRQIDVLMLVVSPPNERGFVCVGNSVWDAVTSTSRARTVIVELSPGLPRTCGDSWIHISQLDAIVPGDRPRLGSPDPTPESLPDVDRRIAKNVASIVRDGDTLQIGLGKHTGAIPILGAFDDCNDLGFFSELTVPGCVDLARRGIITSKHAELHPGRFVSCYAGNSLEDLDYIEDNPFFELRSYEYTNDPKVISRHDHMLTLNGALMVDLSGQIGVYAFGPRVYSGTGGQLAFHLGAFLSKQGRAVTVIPSSAKNGRVSTIVPQFEAGQIVSIPRELADTIVTDYGVAPLLGKSVRERAETLIEVAHPDHRDWLRDEAKKLYWP
ncbi:MAG: acetyl-CoA hydrolase/transferase family protein [Deltaproteobacteria bacterium]|nr:acetyl-CoA hydrolase/transferase family protein [Deltaproteobacteria bacterium]MBW2386021.1 acetyl-CoA hydrolase/transferase family protein [Deltaproteobacteria bacterium]